MLPSIFKKHKICSNRTKSMEADRHTFLINLVYRKIFLIYLVYQIIYLIYQIFDTDILSISIFID